uniref:Venom polypeptide n=1 Tax=Dolopus genitalis TaxID=2488630 RepID=A0A3G5BIE0_DOLGE|nr:venom polypeptide [Dolopus genitalis]
MARFIALACVLLAACAVASEFDQFDSTVEVVDNINTYLVDNPDAELIELQAQSMPFAKTRYTFGQRVNGDRVLAQRNDNFNYGRMQDVRLNLNYPQWGVGAIVTYLEVILEYNSNMGKLYIVGGGIGQRSIKLVMEANGVTHFAASSTLWGY